MRGALSSKKLRLLFILSLCRRLKDLKAYVVRSSISRMDCWDDARTDSLYGSLKRACVYGQHFTTREEAKAAVMNWLAFYDATRLHSRLGCVSPMQYEKNWLAEQTRLFA